MRRGESGRGSKTKFILNVEKMGANFYKLFCNPSTQIYKLRIPEDYVKKHEGQQLSNNYVNLKAADGKVWRVKLFKESGSGNVWLSDGLEAFVKHYDVGYGNFLLFEYDETHSEFHVSIFDFTGCEIQCDRLPIEISLSEETVIDHDDNKNYRAVAPVDASQSLKAFKAFKSVNAHFKVLMKDYNVSERYRLYLPMAEVKKQLDVAQKHHNLVLIAPDEMRYKTNLLVWKDKGQAEIKKNWKLFVKKNNLRAGDGCVFERVMPHQNVYKVTIFRARY